MLLPQSRLHEGLTTPRRQARKHHEQETLLSCTGIIPLSTATLLLSLKIAVRGERNSSCRGPEPRV